MRALDLAQKPCARSLRQIKRDRSHRSTMACMAGHGWHQHLVQIEDRISRADQHIEGQRRVIRRMAAHGLDVAAAKRLLTLVGELQGLREQRRQALIDRYYRASIQGGLEKA